MSATMRTRGGPVGTGDTGEWEDVRLGEILRVEHGYAFKGEYFADSGPSILLTPKNFRPNGGLDVSPGRCKYYDGPIDERFVLRPGDVVVAMTDLKQDAPILGATGVVPDHGQYLHNQRIGRVLVEDPTRLDSAFVPWLLNSFTVRQEVRATATGATVRHTAPTRIQAAVAPLPLLATQRRIAATLDAFDDFIKINQRRIELLEELARSLYREWFVRFRFPGAVDGDGTIPDGWNLRPASAIFDINPRIRAVQTSMQKVTMGDVDERFSAVFPSGTVTRASGSRFQRDDVLFARITPCLENGKTALVKFVEPGDTAVGSTEFIVLRGASVGSAFTYCAARSDPLRDHAIKSMSGASGRQRVAPGCFDSILLAEPPPEVSDAFESAAGQMLDEVFVLASLNRQLVATRDLLFPRLVTGRLDVSDLDLGNLLAPESD